MWDYYFTLLFKFDILLLLVLFSTFIPLTQKNSKEKLTFLTCELDKNNDKNVFLSQ